ncbi:phosphoglycerate mutase [Streptococcus intermedius]|uniref:phosphoglycerate mutase n=1 Tax=Streptococcus intermedius TaxID=1338 RepID=UPI00124CB335|nr:phosphoglycerate mutase [Streptococcus intermedius]
MKISKNWFVGFEPNFQSSQKTILYNKLNGDLYELSEVYFDFINNINQKKEFSILIMKKYNINQSDVEQISKTILENLISLGVILND